MIVPRRVTQLIDNITNVTYNDSVKFEVVQSWLSR